MAWHHLEAVVACFYTSLSSKVGVKRALYVSKVSMLWQWVAEGKALPTQARRWRQYKPVVLSAGLSAVSAEKGNFHSRQLWASRLTAIGAKSRAV